MNKCVGACIAVLAIGALLALNLAPWPRRLVDAAAASAVERARQRLGFAAGDRVRLALPAASACEALGGCLCRAGNDRGTVVDNDGSIYKPISVRCDRAGNLEEASWYQIQDLALLSPDAAGAADAAEAVGGEARSAPAAPAMSGSGKGSGEAEPSWWGSIARELTLYVVGFLIVMCVPGCGRNNDRERFFWGWCILVLIRVAYLALRALYFASIASIAAVSPFVAAASDSIAYLRAQPLTTQGAVLAALAAVAGAFALHRAATAIAVARAVAQAERNAAEARIRAENAEGRMERNIAPNQVIRQASGGGGGGGGGSGGGGGGGEGLRASASAAPAPSCEFLYSLRVPTGHGEETTVAAARGGPTRGCVAA